jgi:hypothetical protein
MRGYEEGFAPLVIPAKARQAGGQAVCLYITALGVNARICRWVGALGTRRVVILGLYAAVLASFFGPGLSAGQLAVHPVRIMTGIWRPVMRRA